MEYKTASELAAETLATLDAKYGAPLLETKARLDELEQKIASRNLYTGGETFLPSAGRQVIENEEVKAFSGDAVVPGRRISVHTKAIISALTTDANGSAGDLLCLTATAQWACPGVA